jgi:hypothetical protein
LIRLDCCEATGDACRGTEIAGTFVERDRLAEQSFRGGELGCVEAQPAGPVEELGSL